MEFMHTKEERAHTLESAFRVFASTQEDRIEENESRAAATHACSEGADSPEAVASSDHSRDDAKAALL
jgi:hypothetical protein